MTPPNMNLGLLIARCCMAAVFLYSGITKWLGFSGAVEEFSALGLPFPTLAVIATVAVQFGGAVALIGGFAVRLASLTLAVFTIAATLVGHAFWKVSGVDFHRELTTALEHLAIVGGLLLLSLTGPGSLALSKRPGTPPSV